MALINEAILEGFLIRDAKLKYSESGVAVVQFRVGNSIERNIEGGGKDKQTMYMDVRYLGKSAKNIHPYLVKGKHVTALGRIVMDTWLDAETQQPKTKLLILARAVNLQGPAPNRVGARTLKQPVVNLDVEVNTESHDDIDIVPPTIEEPPPPEEKRFIDKVRRKAPSQDA